MPSVITTTDLSVEDKSELKTGNTRRRHDMPAECVARHIAQGKSPEEAQRLCYKGNKATPGAAPAGKAPMGKAPASRGIKKPGY
tara:strand:+ start:118 stop:369 length:252 start_codon:yes stop_codon:yes gene_type:complete